jgi:hypothetical protein
MLKPFLAGDVLERVLIDVIWPHTRSRHDNMFLVTIMDHFSKWVDAFPAETVAGVLFNSVGVSRDASQDFE